MKKIFFLGSLKIELITDFEISLYEFDCHFEKQILPISKQITIHVVQDKFSEKLRNCIYRNSGIEIFDEDGKECRVYNTKNDYGIVSVYDRLDTIQIYVPDNNSIFLQRFRPWFHIHLEELLLYNHAMILHSASIEYGNRGILFSAPSGKGKTTQTNLWHKYKQNVTDINGDRTILQLINEKWYACGFPVYGSSVRCQQKAVPIKAIVFLEQGKRNEIRKLTKKEKTILLYKELTVLTFNKEFVNQTLDLIERIIEDIEIIQLTCTISREAVDVLHEYMFGESNHGII